jgi:transcriptional regulator with XRE-family HTH domain
MIIKVHDWTNERVRGELEEYPYFTIKSKLSKVLKDRGISLQELAELTGIRIGGLSELANMKRSTMNISHIVMIALVLRIDDLNELFEIIVPDDMKEDFKADQKIINKNGILPDQDKHLEEYRKAKKEAKKKPTDKK